MSGFIRRVVVIACLHFAISAETLIAQQPPLDAAFEQLVQSHAALVSSGQPESKQAELVAGWVQTQDWRTLPFGDQAWLHAKLLTDDQLDRSAFSVRWTGFVTSPATDNYLFTQHSLTGAYGGTLKLSVDGR